MSAVVTERTVRNEHGEVRVREREGDIDVCWFCGDTRTFLPDELKQHLKTLEALRAHPDVWLDLQDRYEDSFVVRVVDGQLQAADSPADYAGPFGSARQVPFDELRKAIKRIAKETG